MHEADTMRRLGLIGCMLLAGMLLVTGNTAFAQGDSSNLLPGWSCDSDGDGTVEDDDYVRLKIAGGGTTIGDEIQRVEEGDEIVIEMVRTTPVSLVNCDGSPATPWVMALELTRVETTGASKRVADSLLYDGRVEIHRDQETFTLRIPRLDNENSGRDSERGIFNTERQFDDCNDNVKTVRYQLFPRVKHHDAVQDSINDLYT